MLLSPLGPRGKLRPEWEFGTALREHSLAAGPEPVYACRLFCCPPSCPPPPSSSLLTMLAAVFQDTWPNPISTGPEGTQRKGSRAAERRGCSLLAGPGQAPGEHVL